MIQKLSRIDDSLRSNPRASLSAWSRYEPTILAAVTHHPRIFVFRPQNLAPSTVCTRLRDAIRGGIYFGYSSQITVPALSAWYSEIVIKNDDSQVYIGLPEVVSATLKGEAVELGRDSLHFPSLDFEEVSAFALLISRGRIAGPVTVFAPPDISLLPERPNVEFVKKDNGSLVIL